jgi:anti-sigma B factor antagonist
VQIDIESTLNEITVLRVSGDVDMNEATSFRQALRQVSHTAQRGVIVTLGQVPFIDSAGIAVLIEGLKWSRERGVTFVLSDLTPPVQLVIELTRLEQVFTIADTLADGLALIDATA